MTPHRLFAIGTAVVGLIAVVLAFRILGTPEHARRVALDEQRSAALLAIASAVHDRYAKTALPSRLPDTIARRDPATRKFYAYERMGTHRYRLCATFDLPSDPNAQSEDSPPAPRRPAGVNCYQFDVRVSADMLPAPLR